MRSLPPALASHIAGETTTLCRCWRLTRRDGAVTGFTDHDRDLAFDGVSYTAASGLSPSDAESQLGLAVSGGEVSGALMSAGLNEADIAAGRYDDAEVATFLVNWADPAQWLLLDVSNIGEIRRADSHFIAELRGPAHRYDETQGRLYQAACDADLGDARCKVALAGLAVAGTISEVVSTLMVTVPALAAKTEGWASGGRIAFTSGANQGQARMIKTHGAGGLVELWEPLPAALVAATACTVTPGCDKRYATCVAKYANGLNFRGFPHIPTPDFILSYARTGEGGHDGGLLDP
jgi:uncharacterized phage protein (TIGR02218 family)